MHDEDGVFRPPRLRRGTQQDVLPRPDTKALEPAVHAARVGLENGTLRRCRVGDDALGDATETEGTCLAVLLQHPLAQQCRQFTRGEAPGEIHLEETVLGMGEPEPVSDRCHVCTTHRGRTARVALDHDCGIRGPHRRRDLAVELRQRAPQQPAAEQERQQRDRGDGDQQATQQTLHGRLTCTICKEFVPPWTPVNSPLVRITRSPSSTSFWSRSMANTRSCSGDGSPGVTSKVIGCTPR